jgi:hypothetical protein
LGATKKILVSPEVLTESVAGLLVLMPNLFVTWTEKAEPESLANVEGVKKEASVASGIATPFSIH